MTTVVSGERLQVYARAAANVGISLKMIKSPGEQYEYDRPVQEVDHSEGDVMKLVDTGKTERVSRVLQKGEFVVEIGVSGQDLAPFFAEAKRLDAEEAEATKEQPAEPTFRPPIS